MNEDSLAFITSISPRFIDLKAIKQNESFNRTVQFQNKSKEALEIERIEIKDDLVKIETPMKIEGNSFVTIQFSSNKPLPKGLFSFPVIFYIKGYPNPITIMINGEGFQP